MNPAGPKRCRTNLSSTLIPAVSTTTFTAYRSASQVLPRPFAQSRPATKGRGRRSHGLRSRWACWSEPPPRPWWRNRWVCHETAGIRVDERCVRNLFAPAGFTEGPSIHSSAVVTLGHNTVTYGATPGWPSRQELPVNKLSCNRK